MYNLLIVDDKDVFRRMIIRMQYFKHNQDKFCIKYLARSGLEALEMLNTGDVDMVLTDIRMPFMNGIELLKEINKNKLCRCTILLSEHSDFIYAKEGIINGAFDYIVKPIDDNKLQETFDRAYEYMQGFVDKESLFLTSISKLAVHIASNDENQFLTSLNIVTDHINANSQTLTEMQLTIHGIFQRLVHIIAVNHPYVTSYIPLEKICTLEHPPKDMHNLVEIFNSRLILLHQQLLEFNPGTSCRSINEIWYYVISNIESSLTLQTVSEKFYINKKYLSALFKKETGMCYIDFTTYFKIERAKMLLSYTDLKIYSIAEKLGFTNTEYFSKVFKKQTGIPPSSFNWDHYI